MTDALSQARQNATAAQRAAEAARSSLLNARRLADAAAAARTVLAALPPSGADGIEHSRRELDIAKTRLSAFKDKQSADSTHASIVTSAKLSAILAPEGLRKTCLDRAMNDFNARLANLSAAAGWGAVQIDSDLNLTYNGRPYGRWSVSGGERFRMDATMQFAMAELDGSPIVVSDADCQLDKISRNGFARMALHTGKKAVVCMVKDSRADVKPLPAEYGNSYWCEGGKVEKL